LKRFLESFLLQFPLIYKIALFFKKNSNPDKLIFTKNVKPGDCVIDCGANVGLYTNFLRLLVGKNGFVHSFEPIPKTFEELNFNTKQHSSVNNYRLNMMGLYDHITSSNAFIPNEISGHASIGNHSETWKTDSIQKVTIDLTTLDDYFDEHRLKTVDFMKMDIEGAEIYALEGAKKTLQKHKPTLYIEVNAELLKSFNQTPMDLIQFLKKVGYQNFYYQDEKSLELKCFEKLVTSGIEINTNMLAIA
jgi:FkbM family methyltransferase